MLFMVLALNLQIPNLNQATWMLTMVFALVYMMVILSSKMESLFCTLTLLLMKFLSYGSGMEMVRISRLPHMILQLNRTTLRHYRY